MKLHHIGVIVRQMEKSVQIYKKMGYEIYSGEIYDSIQHIYIIIMKQKSEDFFLELVQPIDEKSSVFNHERGKCHKCYEVDYNNMEEFQNWFKKLHIGRLYTKPILASAWQCRKVCFGCLNNGEMVEFISQE